jgi:1-acyl-sn-glycerol-3-phosphate acyltransferase
MFTIFYIVTYAGFVFGMSSITNQNYLIPLWIMLAPFVTVFVLLMLFQIFTPFYLLTGHKNSFFTYTTRSMGYTVSRFIARLRPIYHGLENIPQSGKTVFYSTHKSYTDVFILLSTIKRPLAFTPKKTLYSIPVIGGWLKAMGCFMVDRDNDRDTVKRLIDAIKRIKSEHAMIVFPEGGTKYKNEELLGEIKTGSLKIATKSQADIVPVRIMGNQQVRTRMPFYHTDKHVYFMKPISYESYKDLSTAELAEQLKETINHPK